MLKPLFDIQPLLADIESGSLILTPNNRLASKMLDAWGQHQQKQGKQAWRAPNIYAIENWLSEQWQQLVAAAHPQADCLVLSNPQELLLWEQIIAADDEKPPLLNATGLAKSARDALQSLQLWCIDDAELERHPEPGINLLLRWRQTLQQHLQSLNAITANQRLGRLKTAYADGQLQPCQRILLVDFQTLAPLYRQLLQAAGRELREFQWPENTQDRSQQTRFNDPQQELQQAAVWAHEKLTTEPHSRVGIIIPDLPSRRQQVERVFRQQFESGYSHPNVPRYTAPFNISTATPLGNTPLVASALQLLKLNLPHQPLDDYCQLLNSPFWGNWPEEIPLRAQVEKQLRSWAKAEPSGVEFRECWNQVASSLTFDVGCSTKENSAEDSDSGTSSNVQRPTSNLLNQLETLRREAPKRGKQSHWRTLFCAQLETLGWPGSRALDSTEFQQMEHWQQLLDQYASLQLVSPDMNLPQALGQLEQLAQKTPFQAQTEDSPLQILGLLEGAGLRFDHLWMMAMDDRQWPPPPEPNPLLPIALQRQHNMPRASAERELELAQKLLVTYQSRAAKLLFSHSQFDGDVALSASGLIAHIPNAVFTSQQQPAKEPQIELVALENPPPLDTANTPVRGGSGLLKDQAVCPFNAFARWRLGALEPMEPTVGLSSAERGIILHDLLDSIWQQLQSQSALLAMESEQLDELIQHHCRPILRRWQQRKPELGQRYFELEQERLTKLLHKWLDMEKQRPDFTVVAREAEIEQTFADLPLTLRIDRIDRSDNDETLLIDYKTGNATINGWLGERPSEPQLPLYALLQDEAPSAISFGIINADKQAMVGLTDNPELIPNYKPPRQPLPESWQELLEQWHDSLTQLATSYRNGEAEVTPYHPQAFYYQGELLPLNRWPEQAEISRKLESKT
ncbi:PD-(D/E)XK nuclease family protein [Porticoccus sp. W117]|uniref:PD-(D/E)XK nuclease family protein n=1 Tax=Porticoccus sp. W117 TaxID=3054777 RepID=UPI0025980C3B|nr:PD-(D/E)XK nuclease family protein [Porticoccus sp. W117]MDM3870159.1 PD-(D/E)XK nuclease family protein [Porticoccus sp. W117]